MSRFVVSLALVVTVLVLACRAVLDTPSVLSETTGFSGRVTLMVDNSPISGALIQAGGSQCYSHDDGSYWLKLEPGQYSVRVTAPGAIGMTITRQRVDGQTVLDVSVVPANPSTNERQVLDAKMRRLSQEMSAQERSLAQENGYTLSDVSQVPAQIRILMPDDTVVVMDMDEYLKGVVPHEVPPYWHPEVLKAQAVAARSYASTRHAHGDADVCTTVHCQVWSATHYDTTDLAVDDTHGQAATYGGAIINAYFFGHCDGHTRNSEDVWGGYLPYCRSVGCPCGFDYMWGHGVGMCQEGAKVLAEQGQGFEAIIAHYYTGAQVLDVHPGVISGALVTPSSGDESTEFTYRITYRAPQGETPVAAHVIVDGLAQPLIRVSGDAENGWQYQAVVRLPVGEHTYQFYVDDGYGQVVRYPDADVGLGPIVAAGTQGDPTPTPVPRPLDDIRLDQIYASTGLDWSTGTLDGLEIVSEGDGAVRLADGRTQGSITSRPISVSFPFSAVGAIWHARGASGDRIDVAVRVSDDGQVWSSWNELELATDGPARHAVGETQLTHVSGQAIQWRATCTSSEPGNVVLDNLLVACMDGQVVLGSTSDGAQVGGLASEPQVVSRTMWGADESLMLRAPEYRTPVAVVLSHTPRVPVGTGSDAVVRALYAWDGVLRQRGDLGANYYIDSAGTIYEGRVGGPGVAGAHSGRYDYGSIGIALIDDGAQELPTEAALASVCRLLAWRCVENAIDPHAEALFVDAVLPMVMSACDVGLVPCAKDGLHAYLPAIRDCILAEMAGVPPTVAIDWPADSEQVRAVVRPQLSTSAVITQVTYYVDGDLRAIEDALPGTWRWNTSSEPDGSHTLRVVVANAAGQDDATIAVMVDNTPPTGMISAPAWVDDIWVPITFDVQGAASIQFSNDWLWEGEELLHAQGTGDVVEDPQALNALTWRALAGANAPGGWYGPYACGLKSWRNYDVYHRLKTPDNSLDVGLATLDIVDDQGRRVYYQQALSALDFPTGGSYCDFSMALAYEGQWPTCDDANVDDGLEFRIWYSGAGDLWWDRVSVFTEPEALESPYYWGVDDIEGQQRVLVRALDEAGNALERELLVGLDRQPPNWVEYGIDYACVEDGGSGVAADDLWYAVSTDGGASWSEWMRIVEGIDVHSSQRVCVGIPDVSGTHVVFLGRDHMGREATSQAMAIPQTTPQPSITATSTLSATPSATITATASSTASVTPTLTETPQPTLTPTPEKTIEPGPTVPTGTPTSVLWLPLITRQ